jgi:hypothetical protein
MDNVGILYGHLEYLYCGHLEYISAIWYIFGIFSPCFWYIVSRKNLATLWRRRATDRRRKVWATTQYVVFYKRPKHFFQEDEKRKKNLARILFRFGAGIRAARWYTYFQTKYFNSGKFWRALQWKMLVYSMTIWSIYSHLIYFLAIWYSLG